MSALRRSIRDRCNPRACPTTWLRPSRRRRPRAPQTPVRTARLHTPRSRGRARPGAPCPATRRRSSPAHPGGSWPYRRCRGQARGRVPRRCRTTHPWRPARCVRATRTSHARARHSPARSAPGAEAHLFRGQSCRSAHSFAARLLDVGRVMGLLAFLLRPASGGVVRADLFSVRRIAGTIGVVLWGRLDLVPCPGQVHRLVVTSHTLDEARGDEHFLPEDPTARVDHEIGGPCLEAGFVHGADLSIEGLDVEAGHVQASDGLRICPKVTVHCSSRTSSRRPKKARYRCRATRRSSVVTSSPRSHCASSRARSSEKLETRRCISSSTRVLASSTEPRGSSTNRACTSFHLRSSWSRSSGAKSSPWSSASPDSGSRVTLSPCCSCEASTSGHLLLLAFVEQLFEERPIVHDRLPKVFRRCLVVLAGELDRVGFPVVLDDLRVVDRDVGDSLVELVHRISPLAHHVGDEPICFRQRPRRLVDEAGLHFAPRAEIPLA